MLKIKTGVTAWGKIFENHISDKGIVTKYIKNSNSADKDRGRNTIRNRQNTWTDISTKRIHKWHISTQKHVQQD